MKFPEFLVFFSQKSNGSYVRRIVEAGLGPCVFDVFATEDLRRFTKTSKKNGDVDVGYVACVISSQIFLRQK